MYNNGSEININIESKITMRQQPTNIEHLNSKTMEARPKVRCPSHPHVPDKHTPTPTQRVQTLLLVVAGCCWFWLVCCLVACVFAVAVAVAACG